jgi:hypothetical protein
MIDTSNDLLKELEEAKAPGLRTFNLAILSSCIYIVGVAIMITFDGVGFSFRVGYVDWTMLAVFLTLPVVGLLFFLLQKTIGWVVSAFYYQCMGMMLIWLFWGNVVSKSPADLWERKLVRGYAWSMLVLLLCCFLFSKSVRRVLKVNTAIIILTEFLVFISAVICLFELG